MPPSGGFFYVWNMATEFVITAKNNPEKFKDIVFKDSKSTYSFDFSPWADDNHDVTTVTWTVRSGNAAVSGQALTSSVATALVSFTETGHNLIQVKGATASNEVYVAYLDAYVKDPEVLTNDYGICD